jgi:hypothetical protein
MAVPLSTERLILIPATLVLADAERHNRLEFQHQLQARVLDEWPPAPRDEDAIGRDVETLRIDPDAAPAWYLVGKRAKPVLLGVASPTGCVLLAQFRGQGFEDEAAAALGLPGR